VYRCWVGIVLIGIGYDFNKNSDLNFRYNHGLNCLFKGELSEFINGYKLRNSVFQLNLEYWFN
jgi:hypothetical protein